MKNRKRVFFANNMETVRLMVVEIMASPWY